ncbi:unnamed protein product, partial [Allacma fusca]
CSSSKSFLLKIPKVTMVMTAWQLRDSDPPPPYTEVANENAPPPSYFEISNSTQLLHPSLVSSEPHHQTPSRLTRNDRVIPTVSHSVISVSNQTTPRLYNEHRSDFTRNSIRSSTRRSESSYSPEDDYIPSEKKTIVAYCVVIGLSVFLIFAVWVYTSINANNTSLFKLTPADNKNREFYRPAVNFPEIQISRDELDVYNITIVP